MPFPGKQGWAILTKDKAQRLTPLERVNLITYNIGQFAFSKGNYNGAEMAEMLRKNLPRYG